MPVRSPSHRAPILSEVWPSVGRHVWVSGATTEPQAHPRGHLVYAASGVLAVHTVAGTSVVPANRVAWTPARFEHRHRAHGETDMRIVFLPPSMAALLCDHPAVFQVSDLGREVLLALTGGNGNERGGPRHDGAARRRLQRVLVEELRQSGEQALRIPEPRDDRLQAVARILHEDPATNDSLAELGRRVGASSRTLSRLLRSETGMTYYEWRTHVRVYFALVLLSEGCSVTQVAGRCGWANPSNFISSFTDLIGVSPGKYVRTTR